MVGTDGKIEGACLTVYVSFLPLCQLVSSLLVSFLMLLCVFLFQLKHDFVVLKVDESENDGLFIISAEIHRRK